MAWRNRRGGGGGEGGGGPPIVEKTWETAVLAPDASELIAVLVGLNRGLILDGRVVAAGVGEADPPGAIQLFVCTDDTFATQYAPVAGSNLATASFGGSDTLHVPRATLGGAVSQSPQPFIGGGGYVFFKVVNKDGSGNSGTFAISLRFMDTSVTS